MEPRKIKHPLRTVYQRLLNTYGLQYWWPAEGPFEVMVGAILTQSVAWKNAEKAINNLKEADVLSPMAIRSIPVSVLAKTIRPCVYFNTKALKLKALVDWLGNQYSDDINKLLIVDINTLRTQLLSIQGIGPETADSILLYAFGKPTFVIDSYTRRIIDRIGLAPQENSYEDYQRLFSDNLVVDVNLYNEYHALLVKLAKDTCLKKPLCRRCALRIICWFGKNNTDYNSDI
jgi:endonuclease-3 related protein